VKKEPLSTSNTFFPAKKTEAFVKSSTGLLQAGQIRFSRQKKQKLSWKVAQVYYRPARCPPCHQSKSVQTLKHTLKALTTTREMPTLQFGYQQMFSDMRCHRLRNTVHHTSHTFPWSLSRHGSRRTSQRRSSREHTDPLVSLLQWLASTMYRVSTTPGNLLQFCWCSGKNL